MRAKISCLTAWRTPFLLFSHEHHHNHKWTFALHNTIVTIFSHCFDKAEPTGATHRLLANPQMPKSTKASLATAGEIGYSQLSRVIQHSLKPVLLSATRKNYVFCQFALLARCSGLIGKFPYLNGINGFVDIPTVSICCPNIRAYRIKRPSGTLYCATDLTTTFCGNHIMRIRLLSTIWIFPVSRCRPSEALARKYPIWHVLSNPRIPSTGTNRSALGYLQP